MLWFFSPSARLRVENAMLRAQLEAEQAANRLLSAEKARWESRAERITDAALRRAHAIDSRTWQPPEPPAQPDTLTAAFAGLGITEIDSGSAN